MSCDKLVYDLASETEGSPSVFVRKDWLNILDNQNQNYSNNQSIIDTSQLSNSNKWMSYREAYLLMPMILSLYSPKVATIADIKFSPVASVLTLGWDYAIGLKNWFGQMIHSMTLDYNGTTIIQQTPFINMWNCFKLLSTLSYQDLLTLGPTIGFYPDDGTSFTFVIPSGDLVASCSSSGTGCCNNSNSDIATIASNIAYGSNAFNSGCGNFGYLQRQSWINFDVEGQIGGLNISNPGTTAAPGGLGPGGAIPPVGSFGTLQTQTTLAQLYKSYIIKKQDQSATVGGVLQISVSAQIYLKHLSSFFDRAPLLKGVFMKLTMNLNNCSSTIIATSATLLAGRSMYCSAVSNSIGGVNPLMVSSMGASLQLSSTVAAGALTSAVGGIGNGGFNLTNATAGTTTYIANVSVGGVCLDRTITSDNTLVSATGPNRSVYLYIPAYIFNPVFEQAYLSSPIKHIKYTDVYQYQILNVISGSQINNLVTNGIANIKSVLIIPFFSSTSRTTVAAGTSGNSGFLNSTPVFQSPFDSAGCGTTSPLCHITNFNVQISGQNAIYNLQKYGFEEFTNQLYGQYSVNGGLTDGLSSGLIGFGDFQSSYCYYYVNVERMLPVEQSVPKSVQIVGQNSSTQSCDYWVFVEYGVDIKIDAITGARV
jgi:hypothetical protein